MHKLVPVTIVLLVVAGAGAHAQVYPERIAVKVKRVAAYQPRHAERAEQTERKTIQLSAITSLDVANISGDVTVTRGGGSDATVEVIKTARAGSDQEARQMLEAVTVVSSSRNGRGDVHVQYPSDGGWRRRNVNVSVTFNVTAPAGVRLSAKSVSGNVKVSDIKGELTVETISGNVRVASAGRLAMAKSVSGNVDVDDTQVDGALEASSVSGNVVLHRLNARRLDIGSVSGDVRMLDVRCDRVDAQTISGTVEFSGALARGGRYTLKSHSGDVHVNVAGGGGFELNATSFSGDVRSDLPLTTHGFDTARGHQRRTLSGTHGDGSAVLDLTTFSGSIVIAKK
jgi:putative adhesin